MCVIHIPSGQNWFQTREKYLKNEPMNNREETYAAIRKLVASLNDPFSRFLEPEKLASVRRGSSGNVTGGATIPNADHSIHPCRKQENQAASVDLCLEC